MLICFICATLAFDWVLAYIQLEKAMTILVFVTFGSRKRTEGQTHMYKYLYISYSYTVSRNYADSDILGLIIPDPLSTTLMSYQQL